MNNVLVTGATGFVGRHLVSQLLTRGCRVTVASRQRPMLPWSDDVAWAEYDLAQPHRFDPGALAGVDGVIHLAARVHVMAPKEPDARAFELLNVDATEALASMAMRAGVRRFVFVSSIKVNGESTADRPFRRDDPPRPLDPYGVSKWRAEQALYALTASSPMETIVVRPPLVYGPGVGANFLRLLRLAESGLPLPLASVRNCRSLVSVWNLIDYLCYALESNDVRTGTWLVADGQDLSTGELIQTLRASMGISHRVFKFPPTLLRLAARLARLDQEASRLLGSLQIDVAETCRLTGWKPSMSVAEGLSRTSAWFAESSRRV